MQRLGIRRESLRTGTDLFSSFSLRDQKFVFFSSMRSVVGHCTNTIQWNPGITKCQRTAKITSLYRGVVITEPRYNEVTKIIPKDSLYRGCNKRD